MTNPARILAIGVARGEAVPVTETGGPPALLRRLAAIGQEVTYVADRSSTELMIEAAAASLAEAGVAPDAVALVVTAPSLLTGHGLEIPAVALRARLGLANAECLNLGQGCAGALRGLQLAAAHLAGAPPGACALVATGCRASTLTRNLTHGAFFWGDGAACALVSKAPRPGLAIGAYAECSAERMWDAMRIAFGDGGAGPWSEDDLLLGVHFDSAEDQFAYVEAEQRLFDGVLARLTAACRVSEEDVAALILPSVGRNRMHHLLADHPGLAARLVADFTQGHLGGADDLIFLREHWRRGGGGGGPWLAMTSAFTAQWAGIALTPVTA